VSVKKALCSIEIVDMLLIFFFLKDYAMESDYSAANRAARLMVGTLAGSLAHVTCKVLLACFEGL
jgi:CCR4-NOT transcription complex subunit 1